MSNINESVKAVIAKSLNKKRARHKWAEDNPKSAKATVGLLGAGTAAASVLALRKLKGDT